METASPFTCWITPHIYSTVVQYPVQARCASSEWFGCSAEVRTTYVLRYWCSSNTKKSQYRGLTLSFYSVTLSYAYPFQQRSHSQNILMYFWNTTDAGVFFVSERDVLKESCTDLAVPFSNNVELMMERIQIDDASSFLSNGFFSCQNLVPQCGYW